MRQLSFVVGVGLLVAGSASSAWAAPGKEGTKQATVPTDSAPATGGDTGGAEAASPYQAGTRLLPQGANPDVVNSQRVDQKPWEFGGEFEAHHLIRQEDTSAAQYKEFNVLGLYGQYDFSQYDRVRVRGFVDEYFVADQGENGFRLDDIVVTYIRRVPLPHQFTFRAGLNLTIPTSYQSQRSSNITSPSVSLNLEKKLGRYVDLDGRVSGTWFFDKYTSSAGGGDVNPMAALSTGLTAELTMPFHEPLSLGIDAGTGYTWLYQPNTNRDPNAAVQTNGTTADYQGNNQPILQSYFAEAYLRYVMPTLFGVRSDILVAYADGDPTIGSVSVLHDGVGHFYAFYRDNSEVYAVLSAAY